MLIRPTISGWNNSDVCCFVGVVGGEHHVRDARSLMPRRSVSIGVGARCARANSGSSASVCTGFFFFFFFMIFCCRCCCCRCAGGLPSRMMSSRLPPSLSSSQASERMLPVVLQQAEEVGLAWLASLLADRCVRTTSESADLSAFTLRTSRILSASNFKRLTFSSSRIALAARAHLILPCAAKACHADGSSSDRCAPICTAVARLRACRQMYQADLGP